MGKNQGAVKQTTGKKTRSPWWWVPSLYYAEGIPYVVVMTVSVIMYKRMGVSNTDIALYTSWLYLPWVIKPFWSPVVDLLRTKRFWIITMQLLVGAGLGAVGLTIPMPGYFTITITIFWLMAFSSATHDIAADGFYMLGLSKHDQAWFVGVRSTFYRFAMITGQGLLIILAGFIESHSGLGALDIPVKATPSAAQVRTVTRDELNLAETGGEIRLRHAPEELVIHTDRQPVEKVDSILQAARDWNLAHGHIEVVNGNQNGSASQESSREMSWWDRAVVQNLESWLRRNFGVSDVAANTQDGVGNVGVVYFYLSAQPPADKSFVVNFGRRAGDKSISLVEGERFVFNAQNWNIPAMAVIQLDPKLRTFSEATFGVQAGNIPLSWAVTFFFLGGLFILFFVYHKFMLPRPVTDVPRTAQSAGEFFKNYFRTFALFFKKEHIWLSIAFLLLYRLGESQLVKLASPFLLDAQEVGGLALTTGQVGFVYGTIGILMLTVGGLLGGFLAARNGLKYWLWWMAIAINLPNALYIYLSHAMPDSFLIINICVGIEQFGYGFGFTAYMLYMIFISEGEYKTSHFAITTGFMALGMMIPGMFSGWLQEIIGYQHFFIWVLLATIPGFILLYFLPLDPEFGKKSDEEAVAELDEADAG